MKKKKNLLARVVSSTLLTAFIMSMIFVSSPASAYKTEMMFGKVTNKDMVLAEGKAFINLDPGGSVDKTLRFTNRLGKDTKFKITIEDFTGPKTESEPTAVLLDDRRGPYSLKDYIHPEVTEFTLKDNEKIYLPVTITVPKDSRPGGLYGALTFTAVTPVEQTTEGGGKIMVENRLAYLFYVRINGIANEEGQLLNFTTKNKFYEKGPVNLKYVFENSGNVHLGSYGQIEIKNMLGQKIDTIKIDTFFSIPGSMRYENITFNKKVLLGKYTAKLEIYRGYKDKTDIKDTKSIVFWVVPWKILLAVLLGVIIVVWVLSSVMSKFKIARA